MSKSTKPIPKNLSVEQKIDLVLQTWDTVTTHLKILKAEEVKRAIEREKKREGGGRMNVLFRLAQRYDSLTKHARLQELVMP